MKKFPLDVLTLAPKIQPKVKSTVIFLHGLGDTAYGWEDPMQMIQSKLTTTKFVLPTAPTKSVTINMGMKMPSWYDIKSLGNKIEQDRNDILESSRLLNELIKIEEDDGVDKSRIIIGGFSQGAAISTYTGLKNQSIGGILSLSGYLPLFEEFKKEELQNIQIPFLCCHGTEDEVVSYKIAKEKFKFYKGKKVLWKEYRMGHSASLEEIEDITNFLIQELLPEKSNL